ncbi:caprin homolog [Prorops nasuta]|uniref:caprin homolog n=1 Tax=Prorops nasuta TaxID=863751 RepID=UPI0034CD8401
MPSANPKLEKQASTETSVEPIRQAITAIEHKIRNLEKRKGKLESYRDLQKNGKELNNDQKIAVAKYDEVQQTLEITRELHKQIIGYANGAVKQQKKLARKEAVERMQQDIAKVREVLVIQDILVNMGNESARDDFLSGTNGAIKLSEEDIKSLDSFYNEVLMTHQRDEGQPTFVQQVQKIAEHYVAVVDGKQREVVGTTYNKLKDLIASINQCGYFDQVRDTETAVDEATKAVSESQIASSNVKEQTPEDYNCAERHIPTESIIPIPSFPVQVAPIPVVSGATPVPGPIPVVAQPIPSHPVAPVDTSYYTNAAGFVAQQAPPPPPQQQQQQSQQQQAVPAAPRINDVIGTPNFFFLQESELDSPDVASQAPIVPAHIPAAVNAPIPSQTFTNQNFASTPVVPQQVIYQPPQEIAHIQGFPNPNPPPPIPMPPSHQSTNIAYSPQHPNTFPQQSQQMSTTSQPTPSQSSQLQSFEPGSVQRGENQQQSQSQQSLTTEDKPEQTQTQDTAIVEASLEHSNEPVDWCQMTETGDWNQSDSVQHSGSDSQHSQQQQHGSQQAWGDQQRSTYRGRGGRKGNPNVYNGRGRGGGGSGSGGFQQNGRSSQSGAYYRNNDSNYQNGYQQQRSWGSSDGNNTQFNNNFKRNNASTGQRGGSRGERGIERGGRGQFRSQRGGGSGGSSTRVSYAPRGKPQTQ